MVSRASAGASASGGRANELGSIFRSGAAAYVAAHILRGQPFNDLDLLPENAIPLSMQLEADEAVDDLVVDLAGGGRAYVQAKHRLEFGRSVTATVQQWKALVAERELDPARDRLVAAGAEASVPVHALGSALRRRRRPVPGGGPSPPETLALTQLQTLIADLTEAERELLLRCATVWIADLTAAASLSARLGQALLEPGVVAVGQGAAAWIDLREHARELASSRYGVGLDGLRDFLRAQQRTLTAQPEGYAAARAEQREQAIRAYRQRVRARGEQLDLRPLGASLPPIPLAEIDSGVAVFATVRGAGDDNGGLPWALRRRGRALLTAAPGAGKSVALRRTAAHYAARDDWPLPLHAVLPQVSRLMRTAGLRDALLDACVLELPRDEQAPVRQAALQALAEGDALVLLDGLDEVRSSTRRAHLLGELQVLLSEIHPAVEVLMSTRHVAYADAHTLGLADLHLASPNTPSRTARAILTAAARASADHGAREWVDLRTSWVEERLRIDRELSDTPLMVVLLALLAAASDIDSLPSSRAAVLSQVVRDVVERWEAGVRLDGGEPKLASLLGRDAVRAAHEAFTAIGATVFEAGEAAFADVVQAVADRLAGPFALAPAPADSVAEAAFWLWDEAGCSSPMARHGG